MPLIRKLIEELLSGNQISLADMQRVLADVEKTEDPGVLISDLVEAKIPTIVVAKLVSKHLGFPLYPMSDAALEYTDELSEPVRTIKSGIFWLYASNGVLYLTNPLDRGGLDIAKMAASIASDAPVGILTRAQLLQNGAPASAKLPATVATPTRAPAEAPAAASATQTKFHRGETESVANIFEELVNMAWEMTAERIELRPDLRDVAVQIFPAGLPSRALTRISLDDLRTIGAHLSELCANGRGARGAGVSMIWDPGFSKKNQEQIPFINVTSVPIIRGNQQHAAISIELPIRMPAETAVGTRIPLWSREVLSHGGLYLLVGRRQSGKTRFLSELLLESRHSIPVLAHRACAGRSLGYLNRSDPAAALKELAEGFDGVLVVDGFAYLPEVVSLIADLVASGRIVVATVNSAVPLSVFRDFKEHLPADHLRKGYALNRYPKLCRSCAVPKDDSFVRGKGCAECGSTGYEQMGLSGLFGVSEFDPAANSLELPRHVVEAIEQGLIESP